MQRVVLSHRKRSALDRLPLRYAGALVLGATALSCGARVDPESEPVPSAEMPGDDASEPAPSAELPGDDASEPDRTMDPATDVIDPAEVLEGDATPDPMIDETESEQEAEADSEAVSESAPQDSAPIDPEPDPMEPPLEEAPVQRVDDMDQLDPTIPQAPGGFPSFFFLGRFGNWFVSTSNGDHRDAALGVVEPPRDESTKACRVTGEGEDGVVALWAQLDHPNNFSRDLSDYRGIAFWARLQGADQELVVALNYNGFVLDALRAESPVLTVSSEWQRYVVGFDQLGVDPGSVTSIDFIVRDGGEVFDLWIDDLSVVCRDTCPEEP